MKVKISLSTYNLDIIEAFMALGNKKSQFIEQALVNFLGTKKGKDTLRLMAEHKAKIGYKAPRGERTSSEREVSSQEGSGKISVDSFFA
jgi:hypothetical protein